jgi:ubiquinol-cytochrome c reductase cytochrome c subunit
MVRTGRMPLATRPGNDNSLLGVRVARDQPRGDPAYDDQQIADLVAYSASFTTGPSVPPEPDVAGADLAAGGELYRLNCSACHQMAGSGGALAYGTIGPDLYSATPRETVEAMRTGPGSMPVFPRSVLDDDQARNVSAYVSYLQQPADRGGANLGHIGPVAEGLVAWVFGLGGAIAMCLWLGTREPKRANG